MNLSLSQLLVYFETWVTVLSNFWTMLNMNIGTLISNLIGSGSILLAPIYPILEITGVNELSLLSVMIGGGLVIYIAYQTIIWLFNLIT